MKNNIIVICMIFLAGGCNSFIGDSGTFKDTRTNTQYSWVRIDDQIWMAENLKTDKFQNGDEIRYAKNTDEWIDAWEKREPAYCYFDYNPENGDKLGKIYNGYAISDPRGLAPKEWHVPTNDQWIDLMVNLGMDKEEASGLRCNGSGEAQKLKNPNDPKWNLTQDDTTQFVGFNAIVAGAIIDDGTFWFGNTSALFWTSTETSDTTAWVVGVHQTSTLHRCDDSKKYGTAVRCIKDE